MALGEVLTGKIAELFPVREDDAAFILSLRTNPQLNRYISLTAPDLEQQKAWIRTQRSKDDDYYYVVLRKKDRVRIGVIALYNCTEYDAEVGRWICTDPVIALESLLLLYDLAFSLESRQLIYLRVVRENESVVELHKNFGATLLEHISENYNGFDMLRMELFRDKYFLRREYYQGIIDYFARRMGC